MSNRRNFLRNATLLGAGAMAVPHVVSADMLDTLRFSDKKRALRIAHITDMHILDKQNATTCLKKVFQEINNLKDKPDLILNTGDTIMDANNQTKEEVEKRWKVWQTISQGENKIPIKSAIGNHDVWYHHKNPELDAEYQKDARYGKQWAIDILGIPDRYYTFKMKGWHFFALDSINGKEGYQLDDEQFEWLKSELAKIPEKSPVCVFNHIPIISACSWLYYTNRKKTNEVGFPNWDLHIDVKRIKDLFYQHKNVKICLSGHIHYFDSVEFLGVKYLCNGAVSGNWWGDPIVVDEFPPVYAIIDLYTDGSTDCQLVAYDWKM